MLRFVEMTSLDQLSQLPSMSHCDAHTLTETSWTIYDNHEIFIDNGIKLYHSHEAHT